MFEVLVVLASIGILVVEIVEFRDKCEHLPTCACHQTPLGLGIDLLDDGETNRTAMLWRVKS